MAPRSTALAGAQLAARQLNCESVFRGVLSYGRGWNNAPAVSVKPRRSAQPGASRLASQRPSLGASRPGRGVTGTQPEQMQIKSAVQIRHIGGNGYFSPAPRERGSSATEAAKSEIRQAGLRPPQMPARFRIIATRFVVPSTPTAISSGPGCNRSPLKPAPWYGAVERPPVTKVHRGTGGRAFLTPIRALRYSKFLTVSPSPASTARRARRPRESSAASGGAGSSTRRISAPGATSK